MPRKGNQVSEEKKIVAKYVAKAFGGSPQVRQYDHDSEPIAVDILWSEDRPWKGVTSYSTIGLSDYPMTWGKGEFPTRLELCGACTTADELFPNILASAAFCIIRTGILCHPGSVMPNYVREYYENSALPHIYFSAPFLWQKELRELEALSKKVNWLQAVPISEAEYAYLTEHGDEALEDLLEKNDVDVFDLNRSSVA